MNIKKHAITALALGLALGPSAARAEDESAEPLFLSLTRREEPMSHMPTNVSVLTREDIEKSGAKTLDQVLDILPSVDVNRTGTLGSFSTLRLRGVPSSAQVQVLIDDQPLGGVSTQFVDLSQIPVENIERIEVVRGGSSVLYGANTIGGVVNVITKRHTAERPLSYVGFEGGSFLTQTYRAGIGAKGAGFDGRIDAHRYFTSGFADNSDGDDVSVTGNGGYSFANGARIAVDLSRVDSETGDPQGTAVPLGQWDGRKERDSANKTQRVDEKTTLARLKGTVPFGGWATLQTQFHGNFQDYLLFPQAGATASFDLNNRILGNDTRLLFPFGLTLGGSFERDRRAQVGGDTHHVVDWGLYAQEMLTAGRLDVIPALRLDQHSAFGNVWNPRMTVVCRLSENWKATGNAARSFRAPTLAQLYDDFPAFPPFSGAFLGNRDLKPETAWTYDLGLSRRLGKKADVSVTGFYTRIRDRIAATSNFFPADNTNVNAPRAELSGVEAESTGRFGSFENRANYTYQRAVGNSLASSKFLPLANTPRHMANERLTWTRKAWSVTNTVQYVHKQFQSDGEQGAKLPSYTLWNARVTRRILAAELYFMVNNITDKHYAESFGFGTLNPQPGRNFWGGITIHFVD